ncbi:biotin attachment protein [Hyphomicrobium nitrativorans NL23]|uniref:Biotin attachment protein n=1 Tax=Hyphomicrobium nitrativorans NL23 TaxID=1029756 RepID=V5S9R3_9HYPH|nr:biotin/lipoyl-containing protein [Hyphomicrobium nitrativorans]AHB47358.1 biotin attachment protein [Hyphomicrobium nitrativorans NL23]
MAVDVTIPTDLWEEDTEAAITSWLVSDGAVVSEGQLIAEIMVEKVQYEIKAPASGAIKIGLPVEGVAAKGSTIATIS